jgi:hypothetical protein
VTDVTIFDFKRVNVGVLEDNFGALGRNVGDIYPERREKKPQAQS